MSFSHKLNEWIFFMCLKREKKFTVIFSWSSNTPYRKYPVSVSKYIMEERMHINLGWRELTGPPGGFLGTAHRLASVSGDFLSFKSSRPSHSQRSDAHTHTHTRCRGIQCPVLLLYGHGRFHPLQHRPGGPKSSKPHYRASKEEVEVIFETHDRMSR